jgi:hypothetical protein
MNRNTLIEQAVILKSIKVRFVKVFDIFPAIHACNGDAYRQKQDVEQRVRNFG